MIDPTLEAHRTRLSKAMEESDRLMRSYSKARRETIVNCAGHPAIAAQLGIDVEVPQRMWANMIQMSYQAHVITLAYGEPSFNAVANLPIADHIAPRAEAWLNEWSNKIALGDTARAIAGDSFMGWGIIWTNNSLLPPAARYASRQTVGPMAARVSQDDFGFDVPAKEWAHVGYVYRILEVPLDETKNFGPFLNYNPDLTRDLAEYGSGASRNDAGGLHNQSDRTRSAQAMTRIVEVYFPGSSVVAYWPANHITFGDEVAGKPLLVAPYTGHHTGTVALLSHLDIPDNLIPVATVEGGKNTHFLVNELLNKQAKEAIDAKWNLIYEIGSEPDAQAIETAENREAIPVANIQRIGSHAKPGPDQLVSQHTMGMYGFGKEVLGNLDDTLGLAPTAATAKQSELIRSRTNARGSEAQRKMTAVMTLTARKLLHLALNDPTLTVPIRRPLPGSDTLMRRLDWLPPHRLPRNPDADDMLVTLVADSMKHRSTEERLAMLQAAMTRIMQVAQAVAAGVPFDLQKYVEIEAKYGNLPELRDVAGQFLPQHMEQKNQASNTFTVRDPNTGNYTRTNVSERTNNGAMQQALAQQPQQQGGGVQTPQ